MNIKRATEVHIREFGNEEGEEKIKSKMERMLIMLSFVFFEGLSSASH